MKTLSKLLVAVWLLGAVDVNGQPVDGWDYAPNSGNTIFDYLPMWFWVSIMASGFLYYWIKFLQRK